jgi:hypothetical protein
MLAQPEVYLVPQAVQALCRPQDHKPTSFAPELPNDFDRLDHETRYAVGRSGALLLNNISCKQITWAYGRIAEAFSEERNTVILSADAIVCDPAFSEIAELLDRKPKNGRGYLNLVFTNKEVLSSNYFKERQRVSRWRFILVKAAPSPEAVLRCQIMSLLDAHFGDAPEQQRAEFLRQLEDIVREPLVTEVIAGAPSIVEPKSGLRFYPVAKDNLKWLTYAEDLPRATRHRSRDPGSFLLEQYKQYHKAGLLYSGHIRRADRGLYDSIRMSCRHSKDFRNAEEFFASNNILTATDLANPSSDKIDRVRTILDVNLALTGPKAVLAKASGHLTRRTIARRGAVVTSKNFS